MERVAVADPPALRVKRSRMHKAGDHSLCSPDRCPEVAVDGPVTPDVTELAPAETADVKAPLRYADRDAGGIETMARAFVESLPYPEDDPRWILGQLAIELAKRVDDDGAVPATVRELRVLLVQLVEIPNQPAGQVDEMRLRRAQRRLDGLLAAAV